MNETYFKKEEQLLEELQRENQEFVEKRENEYRTALLNERVKLQKSYSQSKAEEVQSSYDDIRKTLIEKYQLEYKVKLQDVQNKLKKCFETKVQELKDKCDRQVYSEKEKS